MWRAAADRVYRELRLRYRERNEPVPLPASIDVVHHPGDMRIACRLRMRDGEVLHVSVDDLSLMLGPSDPSRRWTPVDFRAYLRSLIDNQDRNAAYARARDLLLANLTERQRADCLNRLYFDVKGGQSGHTYRIHTTGTLGNVRRMRRGLLKSNPDMAYCFGPTASNLLVAPDVWLAQKIALESFEREALAVANASAYV